MRMVDASAQEGIPGYEGREDFHVLKSFYSDATQMAGKDLAKAVAHLELVTSALKGDAGNLIRGGKYLATREGYEEVAGLIKEVGAMADKLSSLAGARRRKILGNLR